MSIYILEDNLFQRDYLIKIVHSICENIGLVSVEICETTHPETLIQLCKSATSDKNLYFIDLKIDGDETAGLKAAKKIRKIEPWAIIVFVTSYADLALLSYEYMISAFAYVLKYDNENDYFNKIESCVLAYNDSLNASVPEKYFIYENKFTTVRFPFKDLLYVTSVSPHKLVLRTINKEIYSYGTLKNIQNLDNRIVRCHQSYLINIENVKMIDKSNHQLILENDVVIPISRKTYATVFESWKKYHDSNT